MKYLYSLLFLIILSNNCLSQTRCLNFVNGQISGSNYIVTLQVLSSSPFGLGSSNFVFDYNNVALGTPTVVNHQIDISTIYRINGSGITTPLTNRVSYNIELRNETAGTLIPTSGLSLVTLSFPINNSSLSTGFVWSSMTVVFDHDETTQRLATNPSSSCFSTLNSPLPIILNTFSATQHSERSSRLNWSTSSEINSEYFGIERSTDGETWETLDRIAAAGNSFEELAYEFIDDRLPFTRSKDQIFYYRLRLTDLDGTFKYSDIQGVNFSRVQNGIISIYPNPTNDRINFDLSGVDLDAGNIDLSVFDMTGRLLINKNITGNGIELIETQNLPTNIFNVVIRQGENIYQSRVIKIE